MADIQERATVEVKVNGESAKNELQSLEKYAISLKDRIAEAHNAGDTKKMKQLENELRKTNTQLRTMRTNAVNIDEVMKNLSTAGPKELQKTLNGINKELASGRIKRGSQEWNEYQGKLKLVKAELAKIKAEGVEAEGFLSRMNNKLSKWGGMIASTLAALTGVSLAFAKMRKDSMDKEESQGNLKALTGLDDNSIAWLTQQAEVLSTTMDKTGLRVKQSSQEILDAYTLVGSAKPELLSNKEALNAVTIEAMRLSTAAKMDLKEAVDAVTLSMNQYGASADEAAKYTNVMAAGSKFGSAAVQSITTAVIKAGVSASGAKIPIEQLVGSIETLAEKGIKDEVAGTGLKTFFLRLQTGAKDTNPQVVGLHTALKNLQKLSTQEILKRFGQEAYTVAQTLIDGADKVDYYTKAVTNTNVAVEQAAINSDNAAAKMAQMKNRLKEAGIELMEKLNPSVNLLGSYFTNLVKIMPVIIDFLQKYGKVIVYATAVVLTYIAAEKLQHFWVTKVKTATGEYIVIQKLKQFWDKAGTATTILYTAVTSALTGKMNLARLAMQAFFRVLKINPYVAIITAVVALAGAIYALATRTKKVKTAMSEFFSSISEERNELNKIYNQLLKTNEKTEERTRLINEFNTNFGKYLTNLLDEKSTVEDIKKAYREATTAMNDHYARELLASKQSEIVKENIGKQSQSLKNSVDLAVNASKGQKALLSELINDVTNQVITDNPEYGVGNVRQKIYENINNQFGAGSAYDLFGGSEGWEKFSKEIYPFIAGTNETINKVNKLKDELSPFIKNIVPRTAQTVDEELKVVQGKLSELLGMTKGEKEKLDYDYDKAVKDVKAKIKSLQEEKKKLSSQVDDSTITPLDDEAIKSAIKKMETDFAKLKAEQTALYVTGKKDKQEFDSFMENSEIKLLDSKMALYSKESKEYSDLWQQKLQIQLKQNQAQEKDSLQSIDDRMKKEKRLLLDSYLDQTIDKKAFDEGTLQLDYDALKAKRDLYTKDSKEYNQYQTQLDDLCYQDKLKRQQEYEEKIKAFRSEYQKKTTDELMQEAIGGWDAIRKAGILSEEEYQKIIRAIREKYAIQKGAEEVGYGKNDQKRAKETNDIVDKAKAQTGNKGNPETDSFFDSMFGNDAKLHSGILTELKSMEEQGFITHKQYLDAKAQADGEYAENLSSKMEMAYAQIASVMSATSSYMDACQDAETAKIEKKYEKEISAAGKNSAKVAKLEDAKEKEIAKVKSKYNKKKTAMQIAQALAETAIGAMNAYNAGWEAGFPAGPILAPLFAGIAIANGLLQVATIKKQAAAQETGYYQGGFTGPGVWNEEKGTVHADEFVANRYAVRNKELLPVLRLIDNAQKNNTVGSLTAADVTTVLSGGKAAVPVPASSGSTVNDGTEAALLVSVMSHNSAVIDKLNKRLEEPFHTVNTVDGPDGMKQAFDKYNSIQKNKSRG